MIEEVDEQLVLQAEYAISDQKEGTPDDGTSQPEVRQHTPPIKDAWIGYSSDGGKKERFLDKEKEAKQMGLCTTRQHGQDPWSASGESTGPKSYDREGANEWVANSWPGPNLVYKKMVPSPTEGPKSKRS